MSDLRRLPISAFDPRLRPLLERGCREVVEVPCDSAKQAQHFRNILNVYRARLKKEFPHDLSQWEPLYNTIVSTKRGAPEIVTLRPRHSEFDTILSRVGAEKPPHLEEDPLKEFEK